MDLKIVGAGHLGIRLAVLWKEEFPDSTVLLKTKHNDPDRKKKWESLGFEPISTEEETDSNREKTPFVVFCAPPTNNPMYAEDVESSIRKDWESDGGENSAFVFTASGGVYAENNGGEIEENSEVLTSSERSKTLISAEKKVLENGGVVIRFGGLYTKTRGAHNFWLGGETSEFSSCPNGLINLVHYDDAARCVMEALLNPQHGEPDKRLFLASDGVPISRSNICQAAVKCPYYKEKVIPKFTGATNMVDGKRYNTSFISKALKWKPNFETFESFMNEHHEEELNVDQFW